MVEEGIRNQNQNQKNKNLYMYIYIFHLGNTANFFRHLPFPIHVFLCHVVEGDGIVTIVTRFVLLWVG